MKTADLIPFILLELNECDKYGFELTKAIETKSNGNIIIKQPTLYTLLKKLEKSKFIASYWQDSDIGGKRHYYKLTENGRLQVSTLPSYDFLLNKALSDSQSDDEIDNEFETASAFSNTFTPQPTAPIESVLPTNEIFENSSIDNSTELDINITNAEILKDENIANDEKFAQSQDVMKFTEKTVSSPNIASIPNESLKKHASILDIDFALPKNNLKVEYVDYINFKNDENYKYSKTVASKLFLKSLATSACLIGLVILFSIITSFFGRSTLYYVFFITSILTSIFYPILNLINKDKIRFKYKNTKYNLKSKQRLYFGITVVLFVLVVCIVVNISIKNNSIGSIFNFKNFANFYAPILFSSVYFLDVLFNNIFLKKLSK